MKKLGSRSGPTLRKGKWPITGGRKSKAGVRLIVPPVGLKGAPIKAQVCTLGSGENSLDSDRSLIGRDIIRVMNEERYLVSTHTVEAGDSLETVGKNIKKWLDSLGDYGLHSAVSTSKGLILIAELEYLEGDEDTDDHSG